MGGIEGYVEGLHMGKRLTPALRGTVEEMGFFKINNDDDDERQNMKVFK